MDDKDMLIELIRQEISALKQKELDIREKIRFYEDFLEKLILERNDKQLELPL
jgi:hypothetical protein